MPKISVIIPIYNAEPWLAGCLDSVLAQSDQDFEIICVNDGSTDNSASLLTEYAERDKRIRVRTQKNQGQSVARNVGLDMAQGDYIFFLDADDTLPRHALAVLLKMVEKTQAPIAVSRFFKTGTVRKNTCRIRRPALKCFVRDRRVFSTPCNKLYRSDILKDSRFIPNIYFEDWPFLTILFGQIPFYADTDTPCYVYNDKNVSTIRSPFTEKKTDSYLTGIKAVADFYRDRPDRALARRRIAVAVKMMVAKVYKTRDKGLARYLLQKMKPLFQNKTLVWWSLSPKTLYRLWRMRASSKK